MKTPTRVYIFLLLTFLSSSCLAQDNFFVALSSVKARALAMGGAFTSISDDLTAIDMNPAAFDMYRLSVQGKFTFFLNPVAPITAMFRNSEITRGNHPWYSDAAIGISLALKGIAFSSKALDVALLLGEEIPCFGPRRFDGPVFQLEDYVSNLSNTLVARVRLADQVSIGLSTILLRSELNDNANWGIGLSYGILLQPDSGFDVGLVYHDLPKKYAETRISSDRIVDETLNLGISYTLFNATLLSADIRNISEETGVATREFHAGLEQKILDHLAFRTGYYRIRSEKANVYSCGVGILDLNQFKDTENTFKHSDYAIEYTVVYRDKDLNRTFWHYLSLLVRI